MDPVITIAALGDNFIYLYKYDQNNAFVVDPGDGSVVLDIAEERNLNVTTVLITHHHYDHTAGVGELKKSSGSRVIGPDRRRAPDIDYVVEDGQVLAIGSARIQVIATPGHTRTSVCYYMQPSDDSKNGILWTGDTLFVGGCGRLIECNAQQMWDSVQRLVCLPDETLVYCGHDYAVENYEFASGIEPDNGAVRERLRQVREAQKAGKHTVPSTILQERTTNPFLRAGTPEIKAAIGMLQAQSVDVFAELRRRKDVF